MKNVLGIILLSTLMVPQSYAKSLDSNVKFSEECITSESSDRLKTEYVGQKSRWLMKVCKVSLVGLNVHTCHMTLPSEEYTGKSSDADWKKYSFERKELEKVHVECSFFDSLKAGK